MVTGISYRGDITGLELSPMQERFQRAFKQHKIAELKALYKESPEQVKGFFIAEARAVSDALRGLGGYGGDLELLLWLEEIGEASTFVSSIRYGEILQKAVKGRASSGPLIRWLVENKRSELQRNDFKTAVTTSVYPELDIDILQLLIENGAECATDDDLDAFFFEALERGKSGLSICSFLWEHGLKRENFPEKLYITWVRNVLLKADRGTEGLFLIDWLLEKMLLLHLPQVYRLLQPLEMKESDEVAIYLKSKGILMIARGNSLEIDFSSLFIKIGPAGLAVFDRILSWSLDKIDPFSIQWAFLKGAANGENGKALMQGLNEKGSISFWTFQRAIKIAETQGDIEIANWIQELQKSKYQEGKLYEMTPCDIQLMLASSDKPSGYHFLGDLPVRYQWIPLEQAELDRMALDGDLPVDQEDLFEGSDVVIVDDAQTDLQVNEITAYEAELFRKLYQRIKHGHTPLDIRGNETYKRSIYEIFRKMMTRPSGRWLLVSACRLQHKLPIINGGDSPTYYSKMKSIFMPLQARMSDDADLFHEVTHALNHARDESLYFKLASWKSLNFWYTDLEEQRTIAGSNEECGPIPAFALCENTYRCERGYPRRHGHAKESPDN